MEWVSIFCSGNRPELWHNIYNSLKSNKVPYRVIMVGDIIPESLPPNFKFIYSKTKPAQCAEIALRACTGEFVSMIQDDYILSDNFYDILVKNYTELNNSNNIFCGRMRRSGKNATHTYASHIPGSPLLNYIGLGKTTRVQELGIDRRFLGSYWDLDLLMRHLEDGGRIIYNNSVAMDEWHPGKKDGQKKRRKENSLCRKLRRDSNFYHRLWVAPLEEIPNLNKNDIYCQDHTGALLKKRRLPFDPFQRKRLRTVNQGKQNNTWHG
jgi:hypothetical protein